MPRQEGIAEGEESIYRFGTDAVAAEGCEIVVRVTVSGEWFVMYGTLNTKWSRVVVEHVR